MKNIIDPKFIYTPNEIGSDLQHGMNLVPSKKEGKFMSYKTIIKEIEKGKLNTVGKKKAKNGAIFYKVKGEDLIQYIREYTPKYRWPKELK